MIKIKRATTNDIDELVRMRMAYLISDFGTISDKQKEMILQQLPGYFEQHLEKDLFVYAAVDEKRVVATAFLLIFEKPANPSFITGKTGLFLNVYTEVEYRHKGIATKLLQLAIQEAQTMGVSVIELKATRDGLPLYQKLGFQIQGTEHVPMKLTLPIEENQL